MGETQYHQDRTVVVIAATITMAEGHRATRERKRTSGPAKESRPRKACCGAASNVLDGEKYYKARLDAEPDAAREGMERGHGLKYSDEGREYDQHGDEDMHKHGCGGGVGPLEEVIEVRTPGRLDGRSARVVRGIVIVVVVMGVAART